MNIPNGCRRVTKDSKIALDDHKSKCKIIFLNRGLEDTQVIKVDNCVITEGIRCDHLVINARAVEHFVELKGSKIDHAIEQIERTVELLSADKQRQPKLCFVIGTRIPSASPKTQELKVRFKKKYNSTLIFKTKFYEHEL